MVADYPLPLSCHNLELIRSEVHSGTQWYTGVHRGSDHITPTGDLIELEIICIYLEWRNTAPSVICDMFIEN